MAQLLKFWNNLRASYWFLPALMSVAAAVAAFGLVAIDGVIGNRWIESVPWIYRIQAEGSRALLSTVAGSMIGVAGVTFSITIAALSYTTATLGPRLLTNFMNDTGNQITLGTFVATFVYCLLVLRTVQAGDDTAAAFIPHLALVFALGFAMASLSVLIYFIHHITDSLHVSNVVANVAGDLDAFIDDYERRAEAGRDHPVPRLPLRFTQERVAIRAKSDGYIQNLVHASLIRTATIHDLVVRIERGPGDFVTRGQVLLLAWPESRIDATIANSLVDAYAIGRQRTRSQDVFFLVHELVEIAARALSPGVNDPYTAMGCLDWLCVSLHRVARSDVADRHGFDGEARLRVWSESFHFESLANAVFDPLRAYFVGDRNAALHMLERIGGCAEFLGRADHRDLLERHARAVHEGARAAAGNSLDRNAIDAGYRRAMNRLAAASLIAPPLEYSAGRTDRGDDRFAIRVS